MLHRVLVAVIFLACIQPAFSRQVAAVSPVNPAEIVNAPLEAGPQNELHLASFVELIAPCFHHIIFNTRSKAAIFCKL